MAKLAEQAERFEEMIGHMKEVINLNPNLSTEERNLLSISYKNVVLLRRNSWRTIHTALQKAEPGSSEYHNIEGFKSVVENELFQFCNDLLSLIDKTLLTQNDNGEAEVFYLKMKGDYFRYMAEVSKEDQRDYSKKSFDAYNVATDKVDHINLARTHPIRLGLALNFSVYYYEVEDKPEKACDIAKRAFDDALGELDELSDDSYKDSISVMHLLKENLTLWTSEDD